MTVVEDALVSATADGETTASARSDKPRRRRRLSPKRLAMAALILLSIAEIMGPSAANRMIESRLRDCVDLGTVAVDTGERPFLGQMATGTFRDASVTLEKLRLPLLPTTNIRFTATELSVSRGLFFAQNGEVWVNGGSVTLDIALSDLAAAIGEPSAGMLQLSAGEGRLNIRDPFGIVGLTLTDAELLAIFASATALATRTDLGQLATRAFAGDMAALLPSELRVTHVAIHPDRVSIGAAVSGTLSIAGGAIPCQ